MRRFICLILAVLIAALCWRLTLFASDMKVGFQFSPEELKLYNRLLNCASHAPPPSYYTSSFFAPAEDIETDLETDMVFLTVSDIQSRLMNTPSKYLGNVITWSLHSDIKIAPRREFGKSKGAELLPGQFNPLGISLLRYQGYSTDTNLWAFVVNYYPDGEPSVVINNYRYNSPTSHGFSQEYNVKNAQIVNPNDVAAISPTEFYVTNSHTGPGATNGMAMLLDFIGWGTGNLVYCDVVTERCRPVLDGLLFANSVYLNHDHTKLYLTETFGRRLRVYDRDILTNELRLNDTIQTDAMLDNINVDMYNNIWVAGSMDPAAIGKAFYDVTKEFRKVPSIVYRIIPKTGEFDEKPSKWNEPRFESKYHWVEIMYVDNGSTITPLSVAAPTRLGQVVLGSATSPDVFRCDIPDAV